MLRSLERFLAVMVLVNVLIAVLPILPPTFHLGASLPAIAIGALAALLSAFWEEAAFRAGPWDGP